MNEPNEGAFEADADEVPSGPRQMEAIGGPGGGIIFLAAATVLLYGLLGKVIDGRTEVTDSVGRTHVYEGGNVGATVALLCLFLAAIGGLAQIVSTRLPRARVGSAFGWCLILLFVWWAFVDFLRRDGIMPLVQGPIIGSILLLGVLVSPPTLRLLPALNALRDVMVAASIAFSVLSPQFGQAPCREDKCGTFGTLWTGLFSNENAASSQLLLLTPALVVASRPRFVLSTALLGVFVLGTGSRTSIAALAIATCLIVLVRIRAGNRTGDISAAPLAVRAIPFLALLASLLVFLTIGQGELTGRGTIYEFVRSKLVHGVDLVLGPGPDAMEGVLGGFVVSEHGQAPYLLVNLGIPGLVIFGLAMAALMTVGRWSLARSVGLIMMITAASRFVTEVGMPLNPRTMEFVALLTAAGFFAYRRAGSSAEPPASEATTSETSAATTKPEEPLHASTAADPSASSARSSGTLR
ncbi:hypothetical protein JAAN108728_04660 [Janibacter anophelis]